MAIGRHKTVVFIVVGAMLAANYWLAIVRPRRLDCAPGELCHIDSPAIASANATAVRNTLIMIGGAPSSSGAQSASGASGETFFAGGTAPLEHHRNGIGVGPSVEAGIPTGYASRAHYVSASPVQCSRIW